MRTSIGERGNTPVQFCYNQGLTQQLHLERTITGGVR